MGTRKRSVSVTACDSQRISSARDRSGFRSAKQAGLISERVSFPSCWRRSRWFRERYADDPRIAPSRPVQCLIVGQNYIRDGCPYECFCRGRPRSGDLYVSIAFARRVSPRWSAHNRRGTGNQECTGVGLIALFFDLLDPIRPIDRISSTFRTRLKPHRQFCPTRRTLIRCLLGVWPAQ